MRRALANRLRSPLGLEVQEILCYGKTGLFFFCDNAVTIDVAGGNRCIQHMTGRIRPLDFIAFG